MYNPERQTKEESISAQIDALTISKAHSCWSSTHTLIFTFLEKKTTTQQNSFPPATKCETLTRLCLACNIGVYFYNVLGPSASSISWHSETGSVKPYNRRCWTEQKPGLKKGLQELMAGSVYIWLSVMLMFRLCSICPRDKKDSRDSISATIYYILFVVQMFVATYKDKIKIKKMFQITMYIFSTAYLKSTVKMHVTTVKNFGEMFMNDNVHKHPILLLFLNMILHVI